MYTFDPTWLAKAEAIRAAGGEPWPTGLHVTHTSTELHERLVDVTDLAAVEGYGDVAVGGRVMFRNRMGKAIFLRVKDRGEARVPVVGPDGTTELKGSILQVYARKDEVGEATFAMLDALDIGDQVWARGHMMRTRTGELTLQAHEARLAGKTLAAFPDRWHGLQDPELRSRQRYVDLFMNEETRNTFRVRSRAVRWIRDFFEARDYLEVETPMMQVIPGGATARPFVTHHNALDIDLYLRIAPELYLKRLVVGGFERVFEINRNFRNEGLSPRHNPEFTMLEFYQAWATYHDLMDLTEQMIGGLAREVIGREEVEYEGRTLRLAPPFRRADMDELIAERTGLTRAELRDPERMRVWFLAAYPEESMEPLPSTMGRWWELLFERRVEPHLADPTFVTGFPTEISPLARRSDGDPDRVDRFELFIAGREIANAFSELADPIDQAGRFAEQARGRDAGDEESMYFDADYVRALSYGMPPTAGEGVGINRLVMLLTGRTTIRDVILFPTLRPERRDETDGDARP